ncbi:DUF3576 domain-containing protein [Acetobacter lambici]|uniref:DUF3576 domain-containing protein n=1 Tax=Acetobacter lambici TaxID=1332824 RepID=A0ABT1F142_9PROT|nr:DUF3576 domain-containing protein [Acetobacter lambici]MCP1242706.1 DUF3576 domain-containing protein [Acetobacter lambici]MCP1258921.1 DUF3576 domain-containing protein [Acetobacter lambici]NHO57406.1 DUF3576 domain-containing protein [Acetobacter lambici]
MLRRLMPSHAAASRPHPMPLGKWMTTATALAGVSLLSACSLFDHSQNGITAPHNHLLVEDRGASGGEASLKGGVNAYLWRAALDTLSFMPIATADAEGGLILTDWYTPPATHDERFKITAFVLDRRLRSDALRLSVFRQLKQDGTWVDTPPAPNTASDIATRILSRARKLRADNGNQD